MRQPWPFRAHFIRGQPKDTHMDVNIAAALWFAAQGRGTVFRPGDRRPLPVPVAAALGHADSPPSTPLPQSAPGCAHSVKSDCKWRRCRSCCLRHQSELLEAAGPVSQAALAALADTPDAPLPEPVLRALCMAHKPKQYRRALSRMRAFENRTARDVHGADARDLEECGRTDLPAYVTRARVLLSGLGADEQMAGMHGTCSAAVTSGARSRWAHGAVLAQGMVATALASELEAGTA